MQQKHKNINMAYFLLLFAFVEFLKMNDFYNIPLGIRLHAFFVEILKMNGKKGIGDVHCFKIFITCYHLIYL